MSLRLPPVRVTASGMPCASTIRWCLLPVLPGPAGDGPVVGPSNGAKGRTSADVLAVSQPSASSPAAFRKVHGYERLGHVGSHDGHCHCDTDIVPAPPALRLHARGVDYAAFLRGKGAFKGTADSSPDPPATSAGDAQPHHVPRDILTGDHEMRHPRRSGTPHYLG
jgi:hypothetical protein